eukprot:SM000307S11702  [mRNA]  locus=s307:88765:89972:- [translate_table: standard]
MAAPAAPPPPPPPLAERAHRWRLPYVILGQQPLAGDGLEYYSLDGAASGLEPAIGRTLFSSNLHSPSQQHTGRISELRQQHLEEIRKWRDLYEFHRKRAEESIIAASAALGKAAEMQSLLDLELVIREKQLAVMARVRSKGLGPVLRPRPEPSTVQIDDAQGELNTRVNSSQALQAQSAKSAQGRQ